MQSATIRISKDLFDQLKLLANEQFRSVPKTIEWLLHEYKTRAESAQEYCEREPENMFRNNHAVGHSWEEVENELYSPEEIAEK